MKALLFALILLLPAAAAAAEKPEAPQPQPEALAAGAGVEPAHLQVKTSLTRQHPFYDRAAKLELGAAIGLAAADTAQTCHALANGGREDWLPTQKCSSVALALGAQVAIQEGVAYILHRTNHHKLERVARFFSMEENTRALIYSKEHGGF